jgi:hypothetical protein
MSFCGLEAWLLVDRICQIVERSDYIFESCCLCLYEPTHFKMNRFISRSEENFGAFATDLTFLWV